MMDVENSTCPGTVSAEDSDQIAVSRTRTDVPLSEVTSLNIHQAIKNDGEYVREKIGQGTMNEIDTVLNDNRRKSNSLEEISINQHIVKASTSLSDISKINCSGYDVKTQGDDLRYHELRSCNVTHASMSSNVEERKSVCNDEEDTVFNNTNILSYQEEPTHETDITNHKNNETGRAELKFSGEPLEVTGRIEIPLPETRIEHVLSNVEEEKPTDVNTTTKMYSSTTPRPTLADDSRLVKISLPTNPIHLMQSNTQFLHKSRNFLNFITEKSTNIVEKALLSQQLAVKYNSVLKTIDSAYGERRYADVPSSNRESLPVDSNSSSSADTTVEKHVLPDNTVDMKTLVTDCQEKCTIDIANNTLENMKYEATVTDEDIKIQSPTVNNPTNDVPTIMQSTSSTNNTSIEGNETYKTGSNNIVNSINDTSVHTEMNGNIQIPGWEVLNLGDNKWDLKHITNSENDMSNKDKLDVKVEKLTNELLKFPVCLAFVKDYAELNAKMIQLNDIMKRLQKQNEMLKAEKNEESFKAEQVSALEKTVDKLTSELRNALAMQEMLKKEYNMANKERENMVMKYAVGEKQLIDTQRARDCAERKVKEITKEQELLQNKLRQTQGERTRICGILDGKCREVAELQKDVERLREDVKMRDVKLKWTQNKLKTEMDLQKETQQKLDKATMRINEMREECDQVRKEAQESMRKFQQSEENKAVTLDQQLKEQQARLILEKHVTEDKEMLRLQLQREVEVLKQRQQVLIEENNALSLNIQDLEKDRLNYENNFSNLKIVAEQRQKEIVDLLNKVSQLETLKLQLQHKEQCLKTTEAEMDNLRLANEELQSEMRSCRQREADLLDFTQKLTDKNVRLQSQFTDMESKMKELEKEHGPLHERISELTAQVKSLEKSLAQEQKTRTEECEILATHLAEQTQLAQNLAQQLEDSQGENAVLKRKQQISMKELTRELQQCRKRLEEFEAASPCNSLDVTSRTGSNVSLNLGDALNGALSDNSANGDQSVESTKQDMMMQRIIKLQKVNVKRAEKIDFLEEHNRILVEELQKKTKIIQNYILHENFGAMGNNERDRNKAELARHGGIMASLYNQRVSDDNMTLELSLEINQKLQAVLEDVLLKNITLKSNIDTLGEEIARLTMQNQQRHIKN